MSTRREVFQNNTADTLSASCLSTDTTISVTNGSKFPATGDFRLLIDSEQLLCTGRSGNTLTVSRGVDGTSAAAHSNAAVVTMNLTAASLKQYGRDNVAGFDGSSPPLRLCAADGSQLSSSSFTVVNASNSVIADLDGGIVLTKPGNLGADDITALVRSYTAPATAIIGLRYCLPISLSSAFPLGGVVFRDSAGKLSFAHLVVVATGGGICFQSAHYNSPTSQSSVSSALPIFLPGDVVWWKLQDDNTNLKWSLSHDGVTWSQVLSEARGTFLSSPNQWGFLGNNVGNGAAALVSCNAWSE